MFMMIPTTLSPRASSAMSAHGDSHEGVMRALYVREAMHIAEEAGVPVTNPIRASEMAL
jgi:hypothetical protein